MAGVSRLRSGIGLRSLREYPTFILILQQRNSTDKERMSFRISYKSSFRVSVFLGIHKALDAYIDKRSHIRSHGLPSVAGISVFPFGNYHSQSVFHAYNLNSFIENQLPLIAGNPFDCSKDSFYTTDKTLVSHTFSIQTLDKRCNQSESLTTDCAMAFFGKLTSSDRELNRAKPIKLPPLDKAQVMRRFELTLVGRPLLREVQEHKLKALASFLPSVWRCEGEIQGLEMGDGRVHFRFQTEADLQTVLDNRPYHYDGSMIALERWVPSVRRDFPNTIPFWIVIRGLPDYRREVVSVRSIGEALGEFLEVDVSEPIPRVRVTLDCDSPLILRRESDDAGQICVLDLQYEKLHKYCNRCFRLTHESASCPERVRESGPHRGQRREQYQGKAAEVNRGTQRNPRDGRGKEVSSRRVPHDPPRRNHDVTASSSRSKPVRRTLLPELETSRVSSSGTNPSTKEWVRKAFGD
ncbi:hypothetical protein AALP_AA6G109400 [Arabis alpina]|uniref:Uncharacterized protein n=1 Tax=Arabis alpina TaxID=50452 RepID=A0A087GNG6_ARAAL|nr:hypothetical protein AALP_AA6G109400 [Arabis alpina]